MTKKVRDKAAVEIVYFCCTVCVPVYVLEEEKKLVHHKDVAVVTHPKTNTAPQLL